MGSNAGPGLRTDEKYLPVKWNAEDERAVLVADAPQRVSEAFATGEEVLEMVACMYALHVIVASWLPIRISMRQGPSGASSD